jgi:hypothetical protein
MSEQFKVGEICVLHSLVITPERNGEEVEIISPLTPHVFVYGTYMAHLVLHKNGARRWTPKIKLRRKPPQQDLTAWADAKVKDITKPVNVPDQVPA